MLEKIFKFIKIPLFSREKILLSFEYGLVIAEVAMKQKVKLTPELVEKAERMIEGEFQKKSIDRLAIEMIPNVMSVFELDLSK